MQYVTRRYARVIICATIGTTLPGHYFVPITYFGYSLQLYKQQQYIPFVRKKLQYHAFSRACFNVPTGTDVLGDLKSVLEGLVTRA